MSCSSITRTTTGRDRRYVRVSSVRPCLVVQSDHNNHRLDDTIVVTIASRTQDAASEPTQLLIDLSTAAGQQSGLLFTSAVQCENILTVDRGFILRIIGTLPGRTMYQITDCLKAALAIL